MASGQSKQNAINSATQKAVAAAEPKSYTDPYGSFNGKTGVYSPVITETQQSTRNNIDHGINSYSGQLANYNLNPFENDIYKNSLSQLQAPVNRQYQQDQLSLQNKLNAQGLTGGSFDAYSNSLLNQNHDYNLLQQQAPALQAYQNNYANALGGLQGLTNAETQQTAQYYQPFDNYVRYQSAINPLQSTTANAYLNQGNQLAAIPGMYQNILSGVNAGSNLISSLTPQGQAAKALQAVLSRGQGGP